MFPTNLDTKEGQAAAVAAVQHKETMTDDDLVARLREPMHVTLTTGAPELDAYDAERADAADRIKELMTERDEALAMVAALSALAGEDKK